LSSVGTVVARDFGDCQMTHGTARILRSGRGSGLYRPPVGVEAGIATAGVLVAVIVGAALPASAGDWRLAPVMVMLLGVGVRTVSVPALGFVALVAYFLVDGFLVNRSGELTWTGESDTYRLLLVVSAAVVGLAIGVWRRRPRPVFVPASWIVDVPDDPRDGISNDVDKERDTRG
jgi:hypothetical protein